jgi:GT2 family glycosyltransferase
MTKASEIARSLLSYALSKARIQHDANFNPIPISACLGHHQGAYSRGTSKVSVIIPTRDKADLLRTCIDSVVQTTRNLDVEIIVVDNSSRDPDTLTYLSEIEIKGIQVIKFSGNFNFSAICNFAVEHSAGELLCFLNNDTIATSNDWLRCMLDHATKEEVGLVGAVLQFEDKTIQHMGVALGYNGIAGHPFQGQNLEKILPSYCYEVEAVTFACAVISREKFVDIGGLDASFPVGFNDVDFSIRASSKGFHNIICREAVLTHLESQTRPRTRSISGFFQALRDVMRMTVKHRQSLVDRFFQS